MADREGGAGVIQLRDYQQSLVAAIRTSLSTHRSVLAQAPTGAGKTVMFSYMAGRARERGRRVGIFAHRAELLKQISRTLRQFDVPHGIIAAGSTYVPRQQVYVIAAATYARRDAMPVFDLGIIDEAHHATAGSTWGRCMERSPEAKWIGVTATPERLDGRGLSEMFDDLVLGPSVRSLMDMGALADYRLFAPPSADTSGVHTVAGDYNLGELAAVMDRPAVTGDAVLHYRRHLNGAPSVAFCTSVAHAAHVAEEFRAAGYTSAHVDGGMESGERERIIGGFRRGEINVLSSCNLISEGFDVPGIHGAILLRPTQSLALYLQQVGRAFRPEAGKVKAVILDHAGNSVGPRGHGLPDADREWSLAGRDRKAKVKPEESVRQCERCYAAYPSRVHKCPECGWTPAPMTRMVDAVDGELEEVDRDAAREREAERRRQAQGRARTVDELMSKLGMNERQAKHVMEAREEKARLRSTLQSLVDDHRYRTRVELLTSREILELKPKKLREWIAKLEGERDVEQADARAVS
jgi:DNA repair protein RadD